MDNILNTGLGRDLLNSLGMIAKALRELVQSHGADSDTWSLRDKLAWELFLHSKGYSVQIRESLSASQNDQLRNDEWGKHSDWAYQVVDFFMARRDSR